MSQALDAAFAHLASLAKDNRDKINGMRGTCLCVLDGDTNYHLTLDGGDVTITREALPADCTVTADSATFLALMEGRGNPLTAILTGRVKLKGDKRLLLTLLKLL